MGICPAAGEPRRQKQTEEEKGTCGIGLGGQILHGSVTWLYQDNGVPLIVVDHVIHHGDFRHSVQLVCKILPKGKQRVVNTQHAYTNEHVHAHSHISFGLSEVRKNKRLRLGKCSMYVNAQSFRKVDKIQLFH